MLYARAVVDAAHLAPERMRPLRRQEYATLAQLGAFADERVELIEGTIVAMRPQKRCSCRSR